MNKLIPFSKITKSGEKFPFMSKVSVVVDKKGTPMGFVFGRDSFIAFLEKLDSEFEKNIPNQSLAFNNPAGRLIDLIEEKLPLNPKFIKELKSAISSAKKSGWIPFEEVIRSLNV